MYKTKAILANLCGCDNYAIKEYMREQMKQKNDTLWSFVGYILHDHKINKNKDVIKCV
jgi:hypothetical protein